MGVSYLGKSAKTLMPHKKRKENASFNNIVILKILVKNWISNVKALNDMIYSFAIFWLINKSCFQAK